MRRTVPIAGGIEPLFGTLDENLKFLESALQVTTQLQDNHLAIEGEPAQVNRAVRILDEYNQLVREGRVLDNGEVKALLRVATEEPGISLRGILETGRPRAFGKKTITPKSANQRRYMADIERHDMVFAIGPGGTGKTYLAVAMGVSSLLAKQVNRIILVRPAVEAGERLGFLPGTLQQKIDPYMRPLYDALYDMLDADKLERYLEKGIIEVAPLAFMRGRTLNDSFVILDEAQNTTSEQMKMFLGENRGHRVCALQRARRRAPQPGPADHQSLRRIRRQPDGAPFAAGVPGEQQGEFRKVAGCSSPW